MKYFGYDIYLSKNIGIEEIEELLEENYYERIFFKTNFLDTASEDISNHSPGYSYFYIHQDSLNSQFPFRLQIETLLNKPDKWARAYKLVEEICKKFQVYCMIEYPYNTENPSPYDVLLYMPNGEVHLASDIQYEETGIIHPIKILNTVKKMPTIQSKSIGDIEAV